MPKEQMNAVDELQRMDTLDARGNWQYPSASESGHVEIEIPSLPGSPNATETLHVANFGPHVASRIEAAMKRNPYLRSGPQQSPPQVFRHFVGVAEGSVLVDGAVLARMKVLAKEFSAEGEQREYFERVLRPYLLSLAPRRRP